MLEFQIGNDKNGRNILMVILQKKFFLRKRKSEREKETWLKLQLYCKSFLAQKNVCCCSVRWSKNLSDWWKRFGIPNSSFGIAWFFFSPSLSVLFAAITAQHSWIKHCIFSAQNTFHISKINLAVTVFEIITKISFKNQPKSYQNVSKNAVTNNELLS